MAGADIDREKLKVLIQSLDTDALREVLERAVDLLPTGKLPALIEGYARPAQLRREGGSPASLLATIRRFHDRSLAGRYFESFNVNSRNFMNKSRGTDTWIAEFLRLVKRCVSTPAAKEPLLVRTAFETLFNLLLEVDECRDDIIFFADEGGSWQVPVVWDEVLPAWFQTLAATANPAEYASCVRSTIAYFAHYDTEPLMAAALEAATGEQWAVLAQMADPQKSYGRPSFLSLDGSDQPPASGAAMDPGRTGRSGAARSVA